MDKAQIRIGSQVKYFKNYSDIRNQLDNENRLKTMSKLSYNCYPINDPFKIDGWTKIEINLNVPVNNLFDEGLHFETWINETEKEVTVAFVFRGTEQRIDWKSNLRFIRKLYSSKLDYYDQVTYLIPLFIEKIEHKFINKKINWLSTGHSLGGGLAQQTLYLNEKIKIAYAFNSSPITGYRRTKFRNKYKVGKQVYRVYMQQEILSYMRIIPDIFNPIRLFRSKNPRVIRIKFYASNVGNLFKRHSMLKLAKLIDNYDS